jgi:hypothetical protein
MDLRRIFAFVLLWVLHLSAFAAIGTIDSLEGEVRVVSATTDRQVQAGAEINEGDTIKTDENAWALLAMTDGASLTLRQNSQVRFDTYRYNPDADATQNNSLLSLVKGAFRSITGYIGRANRAGYRIQTPTATIGIRGTDHEPAYYPPPGPGEKMDHDPGTYDKVNDGESFIRNPKGEVSVRKGQYAFVHHNARVAPRILQRPPAFYQRHAEFDKKAAARRQDFHRKFEEQHQRLLKERQNKPAPRKEALEQKRELNAKKQGELQQRRELFEKKQQERKALQEQKKQQHADEKKKRLQERAQKKGLKKEQEKEEHWKNR